MEQRFYYKNQEGTAWWSLKTPECPEGAVEISKEEWDAHIAELEELEKEGK